MNWRRTLSNPRWWTLRLAIPVVVFAAGLLSGVINLTFEHHRSTVNMYETHREILRQKLATMGASLEFALRHEQDYLVSPIISLAASDRNVTLAAVVDDQRVLVANHRDLVGGDIERLRPFVPIDWDHVFKELQRPLQADLIHTHDDVGVLIGMTGMGRFHHGQKESGAVRLFLQYDISRADAALHRQLARDFALHLLQSALISLLLWIAMSRLVTRPTLSILRSIDTFKRSGESTNASHRAVGELSRIGDELSEMMTVIQHQRDELEAKARSLEDALHKLDEASRARGVFLAKISHEIRTPINGVLGLMRLLCDTPLSAEQSSYARNIMLSAESLLTIINDILDFSKIDAGKITLESLDFHMGDLVRAIHATFKWQADSKGIDLRLNVDASCETNLRGDPVRVRQIITNLVGNAIKFTSAGNVTIALSRDSRDITQLTVSDTGIGMRPEELSRVFDPFSQGDASTTRKFGGTGLGLSITRQLTVLMGGDVHVASVAGEGSTFTISLPLPSGSAIVRTPTKTSAVTSLGWKVLVAEDNEINRIVIAHQLKKLGCECDFAETGVKVLENLRAKRFDLVLMDCQMPEMDGFEATRRVREDKTTDFHDITIIALTANALNGDRDRCVNAGMNGFLSKPVDIAELSREIQSLMGARRERRPA